MQDGSRSPAATTNERPLWFPRHVLVDKQVASHEVTLAVLERCPDAEVIEIDTAGLPDRTILAEAFSLDRKPISEQSLRSLSRRCLLLWDTDELTQHMATGPAWERRCYNFVKILPYTGTCSFNCAYCWFKDPVLIPRVNATFFDRLPTLLDDMEAKHQRPRVFTFTHYKTDCFGLEHLTGYCRRAADYFEQRPGFFIQFLTKSSWIDGMLEPPVPRQSLVSFSINPPEIATAVDLGTASLDQRLRAAGRLADAGIAVAFRVDPMLHFPGWEDAYDQLARDVLATLTPTQVTFGTPRFQTLEEVRRVAELTPSRRAKRFMLDQVALMGESKPGESLATDSDKAYFKNMAVSYPTELRLAMYRNAVRAFQQLDPTIPLGLCEEGADMWDAVGLAWSGDRSKDCSCNFVAPGARITLSPEDDQQLDILQQASIKSESACSGRSQTTQPHAPTTGVSLPMLQGPPT